MNGLLPYEYNDRKISPWSGHRLIKELYCRLDAFDKIRSQPLQNPNNVIGVEYYGIIESFVMRVLLGAENNSK